MVLVKIYKRTPPSTTFVDIPLNEEVTLEFRWNNAGSSINGAKTATGTIRKVDQYYYFETGDGPVPGEYMYIELLVLEDGKIVGARHPEVSQRLMTIWDSEESQPVDSVVPSNASTGESKVSAGGKRRRRKKRTKKKRKKRKKRRKRKTKKRRRTKRK